MNSFKTIIHQGKIEVLGSDEWHAILKNSTHYAHAPELVSIILCGGESTRMGTPKALIDYHGMPQYQFLKQELEHIGLEGVLSVRNEQQFADLGSTQTYVCDAPEFANAGPMSGLLSAALQYPDKAIFLLGCDYAFVNKQHMILLLEAYKGYGKSCCLYHLEDNRPEALIAIYHPRDLQMIRQKFAGGEQSLRHYLSEADVVNIVPEHPNVLLSFDTPADLKGFEVLRDALLQERKYF